MNQNKSIALIIPNHNGLFLIKELIPSIYKQTYLKFNIYLADDASIDTSVSYIQKKYPKINIIKSQKNIGFTGICNFASKKLKEKYLVFINNDLKLDKNCIKELINTISSNKKIAICSSLMIKNHEVSINKNKIIDNAGISVDIFGFIKPRHQNIIYNSQYSKKITNIFASCGTCFIVSNKIFFKTGGFDDSFFGLSDDIDLSWRLRLLGYKIIINPKSIAYHKMSQSFGKLKKGMTRYLSERNIQTMLLKNYSITTLLILIIPYTIIELFEITFWLFTGKFFLISSVIKAFTYNIINIKKTLQKRQVIQKTRTINDLQIIKQLNIFPFKLMLFLKNNIHD